MRCLSSDALRFANVSYKSGDRTLSSLRESRALANAGEKRPVPRLSQAESVLGGMVWFERVEHFRQEDRVIQCRME
ncbi:hypothetical protein IQ238_29780 [Pleurocapsales cyanobacterium LEGE 06147]|nr:hypothetical protein [Pleurocapsales cyanobacterium LEGE 06147]